MTAVLVHWSKPVLQCIVSKAKMVHSVNNIDPAYLTSIFCVAAKRAGKGGGGGELAACTCMYLTMCHGEAMQGGQITYVFVYLPKNGALSLTY